LGVDEGAAKTFTLGWLLMVGITRNLAWFDDGALRSSTYTRVLSPVVSENAATVAAVPEVTEADALVNAGAPAAEPAARIARVCEPAATLAYGVTCSNPTWLDAKAPST
jgi:hypothetical protein